MKFKMTPEMLSDKHHSIEWLAEKYGISKAIDIKHSKDTLSPRVHTAPKKEKVQKIESFEKGSNDLKEEFYSVYELVNGKLRIK